MGKKILLLLILHYLTFICFVFQGKVEAQIPPRYDGFFYRGKHPRVGSSVEIEAFFDPLCPYSRAAWPPLKEAIDYYFHTNRSNAVSLILHPFPLPYHSNAFVFCHGLHIANRLNLSTTFPLLNLFFKNQEKYYNKPTYKMSRASIVGHVAKLMVKAVGSTSLPAILSGFEDSQINQAARISFKYACSRGVIGTPTFFVNGFPLDDGDNLTYQKWIHMIHSLLNGKEQIPA